MMPPFAIGIRYLTGYAVATDPGDRARAEWPPHPARVFMALAAAHFEAGADTNERPALEWLETAPAPVVIASDGDERTAVTAYVPVNDQAVGKSPGPLQCIPGWPRSKQPRRFPRTRPREETVFLLWPKAPPDEDVRSPLQRLCQKVTRIGHSSSLVQVWVADPLPDDFPHERWEPAPTDGDAEVQLRVPATGLLGRLASAFDSGQRPRIGTWQGYRRGGPSPQPSVPGAIWDARLLVRRLAPAEASFPRLDLVSTLQVTQRAHDAVLAAAVEPVPEFVSGHQEDGSRSERPHVAYFPLAHVGDRHASGQLMGVAFALPAGLNRQQRFQALAAVGKVETLTLGPLGVWRLAHDDWGRMNLRPHVWTAEPSGAAQWATVTPLAFDRHAKAKSPAARDDELAEMVRQSCERIGLPEPVHVVITPVSAHLGVPAAHEFPRLQRKDGSDRRHSHVILVFDRPVRGPMALGAGRYRGYGFCRPLRPGEAGQ